MAGWSEYVCECTVLPLSVHDFMELGTREHTVQNEFGVTTEQSSS
jgi:hypothetical protein